MPSRSGTTSSTPSANPLQRLTGAIHVYGGDFFGVCRSQWAPETLFERPYGFDENSRKFSFV
ncbi:MAG: hypothetical protein J2P48_03545 [Alphaproteobacteria bacterium]|nr:hypothetical protein [Alphaproteobacteria bacterium]